MHIPRQDPNLTSISTKIPKGSKSHKWTKDKLQRVNLEACGTTVINELSKGKLLATLTDPFYSETIIIP